MRLLLYSFLILTSLISYAKDFSKELNEVKIGTRKKANASWWGFDAKDATDCLQRAIDSGVPKLVVDKMPGGWIVRPIQLRSNQEIIFADGVVVRAKVGEFKHLNDCLFNAIGCKNIVLKGNATLLMNKKDYLNSNKYKPSEWRHAINLRSSENILIEGLKIMSSGGDGIYIGSRPSSRASKGSRYYGKKYRSLPRYCKNITVRNCSVIDNHRQGISIISVENLLLENSSFNYTSGTAPQCGLDFEPNNENERLSNCVIKKCDFNNNASRGGHMYLKNLHEKSKPVSITFEDCNFNNNMVGVGLNASRPGEKQVKGKIKFINCSIKNSQAGSIMIFDQCTSGFSLAFANCKIDNSNSANSAISLFSDTSYDIGNISFKSLVVKDKAGRQIVIVNSNNGIANDSFSGDATLISGKDEKKINFTDIAKKHVSNEAVKKFKASKFDPKNIKFVGRKTKPVQSPIRIRGRFKFVQWAEKGKNTKVSINVHNIRNAKPAVNVVVSDSNGTEIDVFSVKEKSKIYNLKPKASEVFTFSINTGKRHTVSISSDRTGRGIEGGAGCGLFRSGGRLYFQVPKQVSDIKLLIIGSWAEFVDVDLISPAGETVSHLSKVKSTELLHYKRKDASKSEIWSVRFSNGVEDYKFISGSGLPGVFALDPENLLLVK